MNIMIRSNDDIDSEYPPTTDKIAIIGIKYLVGTFNTFVIGLANTIPTTHRAMIAQNINAAIIAMNPGFSISIRGPGLMLCNISAPNKTAAGGDLEYQESKVGL